MHVIQRILKHAQVTTTRIYTWSQHCNRGRRSVTLRAEVMMMARAEEWVLLAYRLPRIPSTPRSAVWRKLRRLGVAQLGDGLVALPADARTQEQLEWVAEDVADHGGEATVWRGRAARRRGPGRHREPDDRRGRRRV
jgi:hypothetical protein